MLGHLAPQDRAFDRSSKGYTLRNQLRLWGSGLSLASLIPSGGEGAAAKEGLAEFTPAEQRIVDLLRSFGRKVEKNPLEGVVGAGRQGDAFVDGVKHEFKSLQPGATSSTIKNVVSSSIKGGGQARDMVIDARGSDLSEADAQNGVSRALGISRGKIDGITIIGDEYIFRRGP